MKGVVQKIRAGIREFFYRPEKIERKIRINGRTLIAEYYPADGFLISSMRRAGSM
jgi:hypothetical protein